MFISAISPLSQTQHSVRNNIFTRNNVGIKMKENFAKLSKKDVNKLHHVFGHAGKEKLEALIKRAERWTLPKHPSVAEEGKNPCHTMLRRFKDLGDPSNIL